MDIRQNNRKHVQISDDSFQRGQGMLEYGLIIILVGVLLIILVQAFGEEVSALYQFIIDTLNAL